MFPQNKLNALYIMLFINRCWIHDSVVRVPPDDWKAVGKNADDRKAVCMNADNLKAVGTKADN